MSRFLWWNIFVGAVVAMLACGGAPFVGLIVALTLAQPWFLITLLGFPAAIGFGYLAWHACGHVLGELA